MMKYNWSIIETSEEYERAIERYEEIHEAPSGSPEHKEMLLLAILINRYEKSQWTVPEIDPIELIKVRLEDFGYSATDLARVYGDKGTISKVLNYKQALSLTMIRKFSELLGIPPDFLIKKYKLRA